ncbi:cytochrome b-c1 complex subunit 9 [Globomyces pollinis-pini]|nr:cytochrome b-c1 complex subunit 9 [Globomyces pollinis-pini]
MNKLIYNVFLRKSSAFMVTVFAGAFVLEHVFDNSFQAVWDSHNRGRQWKDIRSKYIQ